MELTLAQVAAWASARCDAPSAPLAQVAQGWSIDSRTVAPGDVFFAVKGEHHDGHAFVQQVFERGAIAAVVSEPVENATGLLLRVPDTLCALQQVAAAARLKWNGKLAGVTGSAGKTSTKDIIAEMLSSRFATGKTVGNFNNHFGLPLSILRLPDTCEIAVLEMGMNHAGEIRHLARIARPDIGVITNVGFAHIEFFDSIEGIAAAKRELIEELPPSGIAVLNSDDERVRAFAAFHKGPRITFGFDVRADVRAVNLETKGALTSFEVRGHRFETQLSGMHSIRNILAGMAVAEAAGIDLQMLAPVVVGLKPANMRGVRRIQNGVVILDDSYNSNPEAVRGMLDVLRGEGAQRRVAVLGEMLELGAMSEALHRAAGRYAAEAGVNLLVGVSGAARFMADEAVKCGMDSSAVYFFENPDSAGDFLRGVLKSGDAVLFKGSRGTHIERAIARIDL